MARDPIAAHGQPHPSRRPSPQRDPTLADQPGPMPGESLPSLDAPSPQSASRPAILLALQRTIGNQAVLQFLRRNPAGNAVQRDNGTGPGTAVAGAQGTQSAPAQPVAGGNVRDWLTKLPRAV